MSSKTMKAVTVEGGRAESASALLIKAVPRPTLKAGEVLVKVHAFGLNRMDIIQRKGGYPLPAGAPDILGVEFSGTVAEAPGDSEWREGDAVFGLAYGGAYAEYISVSGKMLLPKPETLTWEQAAAIPENWLTAWQALFRICEMEEGARVLVHAGASGVGIAAVQLAATFGAKEVYSTAGTQEKVEFLGRFTTKTFNYKVANWSQGVLRATGGHGVDVIVDFVGQNYWHDNIASMARDGRMVLLGLLSGAKPQEPLDMQPILYKRLRIQGSTLRSRSLEYQESLLREFRDKALPRLLGTCQSGRRVNLVLHKIYPWTEIVQATELMEDAGNIGKIICTL